MDNTNNIEYFSKLFNGSTLCSTSWRVPQEGADDVKPAYRLSIREHNAKINSVVYLSPEDVLYLKAICPPIAAQHIMRPLRGRPFQVKEAPEFTTPMQTTQYKGLTLATLLEIGLQRVEFEILQKTLAENSLLQESTYVKKGIDTILTWYLKREYTKIKEARKRYADTDGIRLLFDSQIKTAAVHNEENRYGRLDLFYCESAERPFLARIATLPNTGSYKPRESFQPLSMTFTIQEFIGSVVMPMYNDMLNKIGDC